MKDQKTGCLPVFHLVDMEELVDIYWNRLPEGAKMLVGWRTNFR